MSPDSQGPASRDPQIDRFLHALKTDPVLASLDRMARETAGTHLVVLLPAGEDVIHVHPIDSGGGAPAFCRIVQESAAGRRRCATCRSLLSVRAAARGGGVNTCHGGLSTYAAPAGTVEIQGRLFAIVSTCAFRTETAGRRWPEIRRNLRSVVQDPSRLHEAYRKLPVLTATRRRAVVSIVDTAAEAVAAIAQRCHDESVDVESPNASAGTLRNALKLAREDMAREAPARRGSLLADTVASILRRNPAARLSVKALAHAAGLTPNYFSALFCAHTGRPFLEFLTEARMTRARELLGHPALRVKEIARRSGFDDPSYFARRFRQATGMTPEQWRRAQPADRTAPRR